MELQLAMPTGNAHRYASDEVETSSDFDRTRRSYIRENQLTDKARHSPPSTEDVLSHQCMGQLATDHGESLQWRDAEAMQ